MKSIFTTIAIALVVLMASKDTSAQKTRIDSLFMGSDTSSVMDSLMRDFDSYLDSITATRSIFFISMSAGTGVFSFEEGSSTFLNSEKKMILSPSIAYYHKSGLGISATGYMINQDKGLNFYQYVFTPSFDLIKRNFSTGISFSRYISEDSLDFYTTPIQNEIFTYFSYKKWWLRPSISVSYGWGNTVEYEERKVLIQKGRSKKDHQVPIVVRNEEAVNDFSVTLSVRKDFDWYDVLSTNDNISFTPVIMLNGGTQNFGFNTSYTGTLPKSIRVNSLPSNSNITDKTDFAAQSLSVVLRGIYFKGKFMLQPQVLFDYYLPQADDRFNTVFSITAAVSL